MAELGWLLYVILGVLLFYFWVNVRGRSLDDLLRRAAREHHRVHQIIAKHPSGGTWAEHKRWMRETL